MVPKQGIPVKSGQSIVGKAPTVCVVGHRQPWYSLCADCGTHAFYGEIYNYLSHRYVEKL